MNITQFSVFSSMTSLSPGDSESWEFYKWSNVKEKISPQKSGSKGGAMWEIRFF